MADCDEQQATEVFHLILTYAGLIVANKGSNVKAHRNVEGSRILLILFYSANLACVMSRRNKDFWFNIKIEFTNDSCLCIIMQRSKKLGKT